MSWTVLAAAVLIYLVILILLRVNEARLIYFPGPERILVAPPPSLGLPVERVELTTVDAVKLVGWAIRASPPSPWWLLICHGNAGNLSEFGRPAHYAGLRRLGLNLLAFDYRGYGESEGVPSESGLYRDADAAYHYLVEQLRVPPERIILFGHSLGSAVAIDLASRVHSAGLIVEGAFTSATDRGQELYPYIPVRWIAASRFNSREKITRVTVPKLFLHASSDEVIPLSHGRRLYQEAEPPKSFVELQGGHGDTFDVDSARYFGAIAAFLAGLTRS
jgi:fermentation-respiration switch protein FrsA (DUF1100 family)